MTRRSDFDRRQAVARLYDEARAAFENERWHEAVEKLDRVRDIDPKFPGAAWRQQQAHHWYRIARFYELGQQHMRGDRWHEAIACFRHIRREVGDYKDVALLQRFCERQLIPPRPPPGRRPLMVASSAVAAGFALAWIGFQVYLYSPTTVSDIEISLLSKLTSGQTPAALLPPATALEVSATATAIATATETAVPGDSVDDGSDAPAPNATDAAANPGAGSFPRPAATRRPQVRPPTRIAFAPTSTRLPATNTPVSAVPFSTSTPTAPSFGNTATPEATLPPNAIATSTATLEPTRTPLPSAAPTVGVAVVTDTPTNTATSAPTVSGVTATSSPTAVPATATLTATPVPPTSTATPAPPTPTYTATPVPPTPTDSPTPLPPTPTRTPTAVPPTPTRTSTPVPPAALFIVAKEASFAPAGGVVAPGAHVKVTLSNQGTVTHAWVLKDSAGNTIARVSAAAGQNAQLDFVAPAAGVYPFVCDISDFAQQGMKGNLTVR